jgi:hypothetical protein
MSTSVFSPERVTVQEFELVEQLTPFDVNEQADSGNRTPAASRVAVIREAVDEEDMLRG